LPQFKIQDEPLDLRVAPFKIEDESIGIESKPVYRKFYTAVIKPVGNGYR